MKALRPLQFVAVILTALALVPSGAHLFELPHKVALSEEQYFIVQSIYRGWSLFGTVIIAAVVANLLLALILFRHGKNFWLSIAAGLVLAGTLAIFFCMDLPGQSGDQQLDGAACRLGNATKAMGAVARCKCSANFYCVVLCCSIGGQVRRLL